MTFLIFSYQKQTLLDCEHFSVSNTLLIVFFPLDILFYGDEQTCQRKKSNRAGRKVMSIYYGKQWLLQHLKIHEKICTFKICLIIWHFSREALILVVVWRWSAMFTYFASWPWTSYLNSVYLNGVYSVNHRCHALYCHWNRKGWICKCTYTPQSVEKCK